MSEQKFAIRPFDPTKPQKRQRHSDPLPAIPKDAKDWERIEIMRDTMRRIMHELETSAAVVNNLNDPVVSRAVLRIHRALLRIDARTFLRTVDRPLRDDTKTSGS